MQNTKFEIKESENNKNTANVSPTTSIDECGGKLEARKRREGRMVQKPEESNLEPRNGMQTLSHRATERTTPSSEKYLPVVILRYFYRKELGAHTQALVHEKCIGGASVHPPS